jgi:phosphatidylglycerol:prolipoprotein diacylglycerol transferase
MLEKINIFGLDITTYGICLAIGFIIATQLLPRELKRRNLNTSAADWIILVGMIGGIVGSKIAHIIEYRDEIFQAGVLYNFFHWSEPNDFGKVPKFWSRMFSGGGLTYYGGLILAIVFGIFVYRYYKVKVIEGFDAAMPSIAMGYVWGRLGCFFSGDGCYGISVTEDTWLFPLLVWEYPDASASPSGGLVYNTPIMEAIVSLILFFVLMRIRHINWKMGFITAFFLVVHGLSRLMVEFLRHNPAEISFVGFLGLEKPIPQYVNLTPNASQNHEMLLTYHWWGLTMSQLISLLLIIWGVAWIIKKKLWQTENPQ